MGHSELNKNKVFSLLLIVFGNMLYVFTVKLFLLPANLMSCGTTGLSLIFNYLTGIPMTAFIFVFNAAMLCLGWWILGRQFAMTTIYSSLFYPIFLEVLNRTMEEVYITDNILLNVLFAGMGLGISLGMVMRGGASTGGMDIPPLILNKFFHIPVSASLWVFDFCILLGQMMYHSMEDLMYGVVLLIVISTALNKVMLLGTSRTEVRIVSSRSHEIRDAILSKVDRGVTLLHGEGGYLHQQTEIIMSIISNHELPKIERLARDIDPDCFMIVSRVTEVWGRGFTNSKKYTNREKE